jgi:phosphonoacetaldehyde hydrolase
MGLDKKEHLRALLQVPQIAERWLETHGQAWTEHDVTALYQDLIPLQLEAIDSHSQLVPGLLPCVAALRSRGIRLAVTTGYFQHAAQRVAAAACRQGFVPDHQVCTEDVPAGRPAPWMIFRTMEALGIFPPSVVVKVGDTVPDIAEGRNAAVWSLGITRSGSEVGCTMEEFERLAEPEQHQRLAAARRKLFEAGAHVVLESVAELPDVLSDLVRRLQRGETP